MRRLIALTAYVTMVALGVSFVLGFLLHGGRGIIFATGAFLALRARRSRGACQSTRPVARRVCRALGLAPPWREYDDPRRLVGAGLS
jgi:hypothetical protein